MGRFVFWLVLAWPAPALIAGALGWKGVWGSGSALVDYLIPIPVAGGAFHSMTFAFFTVLLLAQKKWPAWAMGLSRGLLLGASLAGLLVLFDFERMRFDQNPVGLFLLTDSLIAQLFVAAFGGRSPAGGREWAMSLLAACVIPGAAAAALKALNPASKQSFVYVGSRQGPGRSDESLFVHSRIAVASREFRPAAVAYAAQWDPKSNINTEDVAIHFFASRAAAQIGNEFEAALTYCMYQDGTPPAWYAGKGDCFSQHETYSDRFERFFAAQDAKLPQDDRVRAARAQACKGLALPKEDNALSRACRPR